MLALAFAIAGAVIGLLQYAPSNLIVRWVHHREHLKWGVPVSLASLAVYLPLLYWTGEIMRHDPNMVAGIFFFAFLFLLSTGKMIGLGPGSVLLLVIARVREAVERWRDRHEVGR